MEHVTLSYSTTCFWKGNVNWEKEADTEALKELPHQVMHIARKVGVLNVMELQNI